MSFIDYAAKEINFKIVYHGPSLGGKTTNLQHIFSKISPDAIGKMTSLATETDRIIFFDFAPLDLGTIRGFTTRFHLYTVPGQVFYDLPRKLILKGADGVVFVADSQKERMEANIESVRILVTNLKEHGLDLATLPYTLQFNKRDLPNASPTDELYRILNYKREPVFEAVALSGRGVFDTLKSVAKQVLVELRGRSGDKTDTPADLKENAEVAREAVPSASKEAASATAMDVSPMASRLRVFLCHASDDKETVRRVYRRLRDEGFRPWLDEEDLLAGQQWRTEIPRAVRESDAVLVCLSPRAVDKNGFVQKEIRVALDALDEKPEGSIYLLPVKLEECRIPERLAGFHAVSIEAESGFARLLKALRARAEQLEVAQ